MKGIELFCGLGAFSLAAKRMLPDYEIVLACDISKEVCETFKAIHKCENVREEDCCNVDIPKADIVFAGIPCQAFSNVVKQAEDDIRRQLWRAVPRAAKLSGASYVLIEQVPPFAKSTEFCDELGNALWHLGLVHHIPMFINAADLGIPQRRRRFFCLSSKYPLFPKQMKKKPKVSQREWGIEIMRITKKHWVRHIKFNAKNSVVPYDEPAYTVLYDKHNLYYNFCHMGKHTIRLYELKDAAEIYSPTAKGFAMLMGLLQYQDYLDAKIDGLPVYEKYPKLSGNALVPQCAEFMLSQIFKNDVQKEEK